MDPHYGKGEGGGDSRESIRNQRDHGCTPSTIVVRGGEERGGVHLGDGKGIKKKGVWKRGKEIGF